MSALTFVFLIATTVAGAEPAADDENEPLRQPGLAARYFVGDAAAPIVERMESLPAFALAAGEAPDARLPARGWRVQWRGALEVLRPGRYRFAARASGRVAIHVGERELLAAEGADAAAIADGPEAELAFGLHPLRIEFAPQDDPVELKLFWQSDSFAREPLPPHALGHSPSESAIVDHFASGWLAVENHNCTACHRASEEAPLSKLLGQRPGPKLTSAGSRLNPAWIYHWLADPSAVRPESVMPRLFGDDRQGEVERYAIARWLASLGEEPQGESTGADANDANARSVAAGETLFARIGCVACHEPQADRPARVTLKGLNQKTTHDALVGFLRDPAAVAPAGRMPGFQLKPDEIEQLAAYLLTRDAADEALSLPAAPSAVELRDAYSTTCRGEANALADFDGLANDDERLSRLARETIQAKRCAACHELETPDVEGPWRAQPAEHGFEAITHHPAGGCLAPADPAGESREIGTPRFAGTLDRETVNALLDAARHAPATPAPGQRAALTLQRLNCAGCHERNGSGGLSPELSGRLVAMQSAESAEAVVPPSLTGVTDKLTGEYLRGVLLDGVRSRPWMSLQMPRFAASQVAELASGLAVLDGDRSSTEPAQTPDVDATLAEAGRQLVGSRGFACAKCHDLLEIASGGTRGPDLAGIPRRINRDWFERWMSDPQRIQPGTRMPTVFLDGRSPYEEILEGDPALQREAIWQYLLAARELPLTEGLHRAETAFFPQTSDPLVVRTFLPDLTPRAIAVRFPSRIHLAFDSQMCRLAYAWRGEFLDMNPVWTERGGQIAPLAGERFWTAPPGFPWEVTGRDDPPPDFTGREGDASLGAAHPLDSQYHAARVKFRGYSLGSNAPTFRYAYALDNEQVAAFEETIRPLSAAFGAGALRDVRLTAPADRVVWLLAALSDEPPTWLAPDGRECQLDVSSPTAPRDALVYAAEAAQPIALHLRASPASAEWRVAQQGDAWHLLVRMPIDSESAPQRLSVAIWRPQDTTNAVRESVRRAEFAADKGAAR